MSVLQQNYHNVLAQVTGVEASAGRSAGEVRLATVGKTSPADDTREMYVVGQRGFGEGYIQERYEKTEDLADLSDIVWHIIGDVQSNKTKFVAGHARWVHTIGRLKTARHPNAQRLSEMSPLQMCIEVSIAGEAVKHGVTPDEAVALACEVAELPNFRIRGLMYVVKVDTGEAELREALNRIQALLVELNVTGVAAGVLLMGMPGDMEIAVTCGITHVRIGSVIFGRQDYNK